MMRKDAKAGMATVITLIALAAIAAAPSPKSPGDAEVVAFTVALDSGEIMQADMALSMKPSDPVAAYAKTLKDDHSDLLSDMMKAAATENVMATSTDLVDTLKAHGMAAHDSLMKLSGRDFEMAFLDAMINGHQDALDIIDNKLMKLELSSSVKEELSDHRSKVADHLARAKALRNG